MSLPAVNEDPSGKDVSKKRAEELSKSRLMPEHFANDPASVQYAMEIGKSLGVDPVMVLSHIHVFPDGNGKLKSSLSADLMVTLARNAGHKVTVSGTSSNATAKLCRMDFTVEDIEKMKAAGINPAEYMEFTASFSESRALEIGLMNKKNWKLWTREMLQARVKSAVVRMGASEVLLGARRTLADMGIELTDEMEDDLAVASARYTADELGVETDEEGRPLRGTPLRSVPNQETISVVREDKAPKKETPPPATASAPKAPTKSAATPSNPVQAFVKNSPASKIVNLIKEVSENDKLSDADKLKRYQFISLASDEVGRNEMTVTFNGQETTLGQVIRAYMHPLQSSKS